MSVYFVTGKLGGGKTLVSVGKIKDYLLAGKPVATNLDLNLEYLIPRNNKDAVVYRIPDKPTVEDLNAIGWATHSKREEDNGLLVLDELGTWLNSRTYQDKARQPVIDWLLHARKLGWNVLLIVQDADLIDKQVRVSLGEHVVYCRRTDRVPLPIVGFLFKLLTGIRIPLPRIHVGSVFYGDGQNGIKVDTWVYRGNHLFKAYDTNQIFTLSENRTAQFIPPFFLNQKRFTKKCMRFYMRLTKIYWKRTKTPVAFACGLILNFIVLGVLLTFSGGRVEAVPDPNIKSSSIENQDSSVKVSRGSASTSPEMVLTKIPYILEYDGENPRFVLFHENDTYSIKTFPYPVQFKNLKPYYFREKSEAIDREDPQGSEVSSRQ